MRGNRSSLDRSQSCAVKSSGRDGRRTNGSPARSQFDAGNVPEAEVLLALPTLSERNARLKRKDRNRVCERQCQAPPSNGKQIDYPHMTGKTFKKVRKPNRTRPSRTCSTWDERQTARLGTCPSAHALRSRP